MADVGDEVGEGIKRGMNRVLSALAAAERAPVSYQQAIAAALRKDGWSVIDDSPSPLLIISRESPTTGRTFSVTVSAKGDPDTPLTWLNGFKKLTEEDAPIRWKEYTVKGKLMDKETGEALKVDGKAVTAEATFTPDHPSGTVDVTFEFDASALAGKKVVAFETLYRLGKKVCAHADIDDEGQTVEFTKPSIGTTAKDGVDGDKFAIADGKATLVDTISYTGLIPGKEYKAVGKIMNKETGEALKGEDGKAVTAEATFTPDHDHGTMSRCS